ncbi:MAG: cupredoxin domain-containing protein [Actinomycetota bacterium]|nr:cupredoxin domain-containing protein [Actinomycetota bacterium]
MAVATAVLAGCGGTEKKDTATSKAAPTTTPAAPATAPAGDSVTIRSFKYAPPAISTKVGGKITFKNDDSAEHTATADMKSVFDSGTLNHGQSKTLTFTKAGTFSYTCAFHPFMHGTVIVKPAGGQTAAMTSAAKPSQAATPAPKPSGAKAATPSSGRSAGVNGGGASY